MAVAQPLGEQAGRDRRAIAGEFAPAGRRRECPERTPPLTLGEVIGVVAAEAENDSELVAVVVHLFDTRRIQWATSPAAEPGVWLAHRSSDGSATTFA